MNNSITRGRNSSDAGAGSEIPDNSSQANRYRRFIPDASPFNLITWENPDDLTLIAVQADGGQDVIYGRFNDPQTASILDLKTRLFKFEGDGWFPVVEDQSASSKLHRELSSWTINGTSTRIHEPELLGNVEVVAVEDTETGANRFISKNTDAPSDVDRFLHLRIRLDPANTHSMMVRAGRVSNVSEFVISTDDGSWFSSRVGASGLPEVVSEHITKDFADFLLLFPKLDGADIWQFYPSVGPNGITSRAGFDAVSVGKTYLEILDTNAAPPIEATQVSTPSSTGIHLVDEHRPDTVEPIVTGQNIVTGLDLTKYTRGYLSVNVIDQAGGHKWQPKRFDIDALLNNAGTTNDASATVFDNDYLQLNLIDAATGTITINDNGRALSYIRTDLFAYIDTPLEKVRTLIGEHTVSTPIPSTALVPIDTGLDLTDAYSIEVTFSSNGEQATTASTRFENVVLDSNTGALFHWWDNDFLRLRINSDDLSSGIVSFSAQGSTSFSVDAISVWKLSETGVTADIPSSVDTSNDNYIDIGNKRMQWGVIDHQNNADGGTETFPAPFADTNYTLTLSLSESTSPIEGPSADVGINYWTENLTTTSFGHNRDNDIDFAHIHWMAIGDKP